ncbi:MAG: hypothetical protein H6R10_318 [Rhodocyclaceae bacterium]|nr:hypothetical protein [Rhodocyclaceae bacterium]
MTFSRTDWPQIRREAIVFLATLFVGTCGILASHHLYQAAAGSLATAQGNRQNVQSTLTNLETERAELIASLGPYQELVSRSIIGDEQRLQWRETLETEKQRSSLDQLSYNLSARQPWTADTEAPSPGLFKRHRSTMGLKIEFQRETALVEFLENIVKKGHALAIVRGCEIARSGAPDQEGAVRLAAECLIDWATIQRITPADGAPPP